MKHRISLFAFALVAVLAFAVVQVQAAPHGKNAKSGKQVSMTGCLNSSGSNQYQLADSNGKTWDLQPQGDVNLADHVGHKVRVTGTEYQEEGMQGGQAGNQPGNEAGNQPSGGAGMAREGIRVDKIQHISNTCP